jgi:hypothetical protein
MVAMGVQPNARAAILGDIEQESSFNPTLPGDRGTSHGLLQVGTPLYRQFQTEMASAGIKPGDPQYTFNQVPFIIQRYQQLHPDRWNAMQNAPDAATALKIFRSTPDWGYGITGSRFKHATDYQRILSGDLVLNPVEIEKAKPVEVRNVEVRRAQAVMPGAQVRPAQEVPQPDKTQFDPSTAKLVETPQPPAAPEGATEIPPPELTPEQIAASVQSKQLSPEEQQTLAYPEGSPEAQAALTAQAGDLTRPPGAFVPTITEQINQAVNQATTFLPQLPGDERGYGQRVSEATDQGGVLGALQTPVLTPDQSKIALRMALKSSSNLSTGLDSLRKIAPKLVDGIEESVARNISSSTTPANLLALPAFANPAVRFAWGLATISSAPDRWQQNVQPVIDQYGIRSQEAVAAISDEALNVTLGGLAMGVHGAVFSGPAAKAKYRTGNIPYADFEMVDTPAGKTLAGRLPPPQAGEAPIPVDRLALPAPGPKAFESHDGPVNVNDNTVLALPAPEASAISAAAESMPPTSTMPADAGGVFAIPSSQIASRPDLMQFKRMDNTTTGTTEEARITTPYDPYKAGAILLWEPRDPTAYGLTGEERYIVANGHYRSAAAQEQGIPIQNAQILRESNGISAGEARTQAAWANIADGKGTIYDQAIFIRNQAGTHGSDAALERARQIGARSPKAAAVALNATPDLFISFVNEQITPDQAVAIAEAAPVSETLQRIGIAEAVKGTHPDTLYDYLEAQKARFEGDQAPPPEQLDLLGQNDAAITMMKADAKRAGALRREISDQISAVAGAAKRPEKARELGVDVRDPQSINAKLVLLRGLRDRIRSWSKDPQLREYILRSGQTPQAIVKDLTGTVIPETPPTVPAEEPSVPAEAPTVPATEPTVQKAPPPGQEPELIPPEQVPFNLAGEQITEEPTAEGLARLKSEVEANAKKGQGTFGFDASLPRVGLTSTDNALGQTMANISSLFAPGAFQRMGRVLRGEYAAAAGRTLPRFHAFDRVLGEKGAHYMSAQIAAEPMAVTFAKTVLADSKINPKKFGAALTEDNLRSVKAGNIAKGNEARANGQDAVADEYEARAKDTATMVGPGKPFGTEREYQNFLNDPKVRAAIERHRVAWSETIDPLYRAAQQVDPDVELPPRGIQTKARINLMPLKEGEPGVAKVRGAGGLTATFRRKSPFAVEAKGTAKNYETAYGELIKNSIGQQLSIASYNDWVSDMANKGAAQIGRPGQHIEIEGEGTRGFPLSRRVIITNRNGIKTAFAAGEELYVRNSLADEFAAAANLDTISKFGTIATKYLFRPINNTALYGLTEFLYHVSNMATRLYSLPAGAGHTLFDTVASAAGNVHFPIVLARAVVKAFHDNSAQIAELAQIGAMRAGPGKGTPGLRATSKVLHKIDSIVRLVSDDAYQSLARSGLVVANETERREFVNQMGQYNMRAKTGLGKEMKRIGISPFITAGMAYNRLGLRMATLQSGIEHTNALAHAAVSLNLAAKWLGALVLGGTLSYVLSRKVGGGVMGRPGVRLGDIDTGLTDANDKPISIPYADLVGLGRALRVTGVRGYVQAKRNGLTEGDAMDAALRDIINSWVAPYAGPAARILTSTLFNKPPGITLPDVHHRVAPTGDEHQRSQILHDLLRSIADVNPGVASYLEKRENPSLPESDVLRRQFGRFMPRPSNSQEVMENYPEIVHKAQVTQFIEDTIHTARRLKPDDRFEYIQNQLDQLPPEDQRTLTRALRARRVDY